MELIKYTSEWVRGEVFQGKIMLVLGCLLFIAGISIFRSNNELMRGMLIPVGLIVFMLIGYGSMQTIVRPKHIQIVSKMSNGNSKLAIEKEHSKAIKDGNTYRILKVVWSICIVVAVILYFFFSQHYYKGLGIGLIGLFLSMLILDSVLHYRLGVYIKRLEELISV